MNMIEFEGRQVPATYPGDAVYGIYDGNGYWLRLNGCRNEEGQIYLEWPVIDALFAFIENCKQLRKANERKEPENLATTDNEQER